MNYLQMLVLMKTKLISSAELYMQTTKELQQWQKMGSLIKELILY